MSGSQAPAFPLGAFHTRLAISLALAAEGGVGRGRNARAQGWILSSGLDLSPGHLPLLSQWKVPGTGFRACR